MRQELRNCFRDSQVRFFGASEENASGSILPCFEGKITRETDALTEGHGQGKGQRALASTKAWQMRQGAVDLCFSEAVVPYRDSKLTRLLQNALGLNLGQLADAGFVSNPSLRYAPQAVRARPS